MPLALDYSYARPDPQALVDAGYSVVMRYLGTDGRCVTPPELRRLHAVGLRVGFIGQHPRLDRPRSGYPGGQVDASQFNVWADALGVPDWAPIIYTVDVGDPDGPGGRPSFPLESDLAAIRQHFQAILDHGGRPVGQYGPYWVLEACQDLVGRDGRRIVCWWQTAGASGSGEGTGGSIRTGDGSVRRLSSLACMFQHVGLVPPQFVVGGQPQIDHNTVHMEPVDWAWHPDASPSPQRIEELMFNAITGAHPWTEGAEHLLWIDGDGSFVRVPLPNAVPEKAGFVDGHIALDGPELDWFAKLPISGASASALSALRLAGWTVAQVKTVLAEAGYDVADIDETAIAAALGPVLVDGLKGHLQAVGVEVGLDEASANRLLDGLYARLAS